MGFVHHNQVPAGSNQPVLEIVTAGQLVEPGDQEVLFVEGIAGACALHHVVGEDSEVEMEPLPQLVLPLHHKGSRRHDENSFCVAADGQLPDVEAGHDRLARARVVGEDETKRLDGHHLVVDRLDLMRERLDVGGLHGHVGVEKMGRFDATGLGRQLEQASVAVERPRILGCCKREASLVGARQQASIEPLLRILVDDLDVILSMPDRGHHGDGTAGDQTLYQGARPDILKLQHRRWPVGRSCATK